MPPLSVLLIEDSPEYVAIVRSLLRRSTLADWVVHAVSRPGDVARAAAGCAPDVVLLDLRLGAHEPAETLRTVRSVCAEIPIVVLTAHDEDEMFHLAMSGGADDFVSKAELAGETVGRALRQAIQRRADARAVAEARAERDAALARFAGLFEQARDAIVLVDDHGRIVDANPSASLAAGVAREQLRGAELDALAAPADVAALREAWHAFRSSGASGATLKLAAGRLFEARVTPDVQPGLHLWLLRDVDEHHRLLDRLTRSERQLKEAEKVAHLGSWEWNPDTGETHWSPELYRICGLDTAAPARLETFMSLLTVGGGQTVVKAMERMRETKVLEYEADLHRPDGSVRRVHARGEQVGGGPRVVGVVRDVTAERARAAELDRTRREIDVLLSSLPVVVFGADPSDHALLHVTGNAPQVTGFTAAELLEDPLDWLDRVHPVDRRSFEQHLRDLAGGAAVEHEYRWRTASGRHRWIQSSARILTVDGRDVVLGIWTDVHARRLAESGRRRLLGEVMTAQEFERRRIARELHDDAGQSLAVLLVGLRNLGAGADPHRAEQIDALRGIVDELMDKVLGLARGLNPPSLEVGLAAAVESLAESQARHFGYRTRVDIDERGAADLAPGVAVHLYRIVQEALSNAARHAGAREVVVSLRRAPGSRHVRLEIRDDGRGFALGATFAVAVRGGRLGLHGIRERASLLGGHAAFLSNRGRGTRVIVTVPVSGRGRAGRRA